MTNQKTFYNMSAEQVVAGIHLSRKNARRLLGEAMAALDHGCRVGLAYALWSLAVEEYGKSLLLQDQSVAAAGSDNRIQVSQDLLDKHPLKFAKGFDAIKDKLKDVFANAVRIIHSDAFQNQTLSHPNEPNSKVSVPPYTSGEFQNVTSRGTGEKASYKLRFNFLYVDWDDDRKKWCEPEENVNIPGVDGYFTIASNDVRDAIKELNQVLREPR